MTNDLTTITGCMQEAIDKLEDNLEAMGVIAEYDSETGYYALLDKILNIESGGSGGLLRSELTLSSDKEIVFNEDVTLNGKLGCGYLSIPNSIEKVKGYIKSGKVKIYNGETLLASITTDEYGEYSYTFKPSNNLVLKAIYEGNDYCNDCFSDNIIIDFGGTLSLTVNKNTENDTYDLISTLTTNNNYNNKIINFNSIKLYDESDIGDNLNINLGNDYSISTNGIIKIGDSRNYIIFDFENGFYEIMGEYSGSISDSINDFQIISLNEDKLYFDDYLILDTTDYPNIDFETLYAYDCNYYSSSSLRIKNKIGSSATNNDGIATIECSLPEGKFIVYADYNDKLYSNSVNILNIKPLIHMTAMSNTIEYGDNVILNGTLSYDNSNISNASVKIYQDNTLIDTINASTGTFSKTISGVSAGTYNYHAVFEDSRYDTVSTNDVIVTVNKKATVLSINAPTNVGYKDNYSITGVLTDGVNPISNANIILYIDDMKFSNHRTNSNGEVSFSLQHAKVGTLQYQLYYEGSNNYDDSYSEKITRQIVKETTILTITSPSANNISIDTNSLDIIGTLKTDDNEILNGSVLVKEGNTILKTISVVSGAFNSSVELTDGTHNLEIVYDGGDYYTSSSVSKTVVVNLTTLTLESNKNILSVVDKEYATLSAKLMRNNSPLRNENVTFEAHKDSDDSLINAHWFISRRDNITCLSDSQYTALFDETFNSGDEVLIEIGNVTGNPTLFIGNWVHELNDFNISQGDILKGVREPSQIKIYKNDVLIDTLSTGNTSMYVSAYLMEGESLDIVSVVHYHVSTSYSATTNSSGIAIARYYGKATGDLYITAICSNINSNIIRIEDNLYSTPFDADDGHWVKSSSNPTFNNGVISLPTQSSQGKYIYNEVLNTPYQVELGFVDSGATYPLRVAWFDGTTQKSEGTYSVSGRNYWGVITKSNESRPSTGDVFRIEVRETTVTTYKNDELISTTNYSLLGYKFGFNHDSNISMKWDYMKIKPL